MFVPNTSGNMAKSGHDSLSMTKRTSRSLDPSSTSFIGKQCGIEGCESELRVIGVCSYRLCCTGKCKRYFCTDHEGKHIIGNAKAGIICLDCAKKVKCVKTILTALSFLILSLLIVAGIAIVIYLALRREDQ